MTITFYGGGRSKEKILNMCEGLILHLKNKEGLDALIRRFRAFQKLKNTTIWEYENQNGRFIRHKHFRWIYDEKQIVLLQIMFIGKTGYGKSSLINSIIGNDLFEVDDIESCTKKLDTVFYQLGKSKTYYLALSDLPGVGEGKTVDRQYRNWYKQMVSHSGCVVYVLRADQRDYSIDELIFEEVFQTEAQRKKVVIALNFADKIEPLNRGVHISEAQMRSLDIKSKAVRRKFKVNTVIPCCAKTGEGIPELVKEIVSTLDAYAYNVDV